MNNATNEIKYATKLIFEAVQDIQLEMNRKCRTSKRRLRPFCEQIIFQAEKVDKEMAVRERELQAVIDGLTKVIMDTQKKHNEYHNKEIFLNDYMRYLDKTFT